MIPADQLEKLKKLFAENGITLTDSQASEIGFWIISRVGAVIKPAPLDKMELFGKIRGEAESFRHTVSFVNLHEWRRKKCKK